MTLCRQTRNKAEVIITSTATDFDEASADTACRPSRSYTLIVR
jgi:hypothetical protein